MSLVLFCTATFNSYIEQIKLTIRKKGMIIKFKKRCAKKAIKGYNGIDIDKAVVEHADAERLMKGAKNAIMAFKKSITTLRRAGQTLTTAF